MAPSELRTEPGHDVDPTSPWPTTLGICTVVPGAYRVEPVPAVRVTVPTGFVPWLASFQPTTRLTDSTAAELGVAEV